MNPHIDLVPIITCPSTATVGKRYLLSVDFRWKKSEGTDEWPFKTEEYPLTILVDAFPLFDSNPLGEPVVVIHRHGGSYGEARFLLTAANKPVKGNITLRLVADNGWPMGEIPIEGIKIVADDIQQSQEPFINTISDVFPHEEGVEEPAFLETIDLGIIFTHESAHVPLIEKLKPLFITPKRIQRQATSYDIGVIDTPEGKCRIAIQHGSPPPSAPAQRMIADCSPAFILVLGVASGLPEKKIMIGDVVVAMDTLIIADAKPLFDTISKEIFGLKIRHHYLSARIFNQCLHVERPTRKPAWNDQEMIGQAYPKPTRAPAVFPSQLASIDRKIVKGSLGMFPKDVLVFEDNGSENYDVCQRENIPFLNIRGVISVAKPLQDNTQTHYASHTAASYTRMLIQSGLFCPTWEELENFKRKIAQSLATSNSVMDLLWSKLGVMDFRGEPSRIQATYQVHIIDKMMALDFNAAKDILLHAYQSMQSSKDTNGCRAIVNISKILLPWLFVSQTDAGESIEQRWNKLEGLGNVRSIQAGTASMAEIIMAGIDRREVAWSNTNYKWPTGVHAIRLIDFLSQPEGGISEKTKDFIINDMARRVAIPTEALESSQLNMIRTVLIELDQAKKTGKRFYLICDHNPLRHWDQKAYEELLAWIITTFPLLDLIRLDSSLVTHDQKLFNEIRPLMGIEENVV
ncbi:MAG: protein of unknown function DUF323 [Magnetococcales bacterium]|nr:protein of unknown function DUF323 [Magnetococcales bacterium]